MKLAIFKYATAFGGGEKYTQLLCDGISQQSKSSRGTSNDIYCSNDSRAQLDDSENYTPTGSDDISVALISNYKKLITGCRASEKIYCRRLPEAKSRKEILTLLILWPIETINYLSIALRLRLAGCRAIILQDLNEKLLFTFIGRLFGIKVFWVEHTNWRPHLVKHPFFPLLRLSMRITQKIFCPSQQLAKQIKQALGVISTSRGEEKSHLFRSPRLAQTQQRVGRVATARDDTGYIRDNNKIIVIPHGVPKTIAQDMRHSTRIVTTTRLSPEKGVDLLIAAAARMDNAPEVIIFGEGDEKTKLATQARGGGVSATFKGHVDKPYSLISKNDLFVLPSRIENFPLSILEALSAGLIIVAPNVGGVPEILNDTGNYLFEPSDVNDLRNKIDTALKLNVKDRQKLCSSNQKLWQTRYNSNEMVKKTISVISN